MNAIWPPSGEHSTVRLRLRRKNSYQPQGRWSRHKSLAQTPHAETIGRRGPRHVEPAL